MKRTIVFITLILLGFACACCAEEWFVAEEETSHDFVGATGNLLLAKETTDAGYTPQYSREDLEFIKNEADRYLWAASLYGAPQRTQLEPGTAYAVVATVLFVPEKPKR